MKKRNKLNNRCERVRKNDRVKLIIWMKKKRLKSIEAFSIMTNGIIVNSGKNIFEFCSFALTRSRSFHSDLFFFLLVFRHFFFEALKSFDCFLRVYFIMYGIKWKSRCVIYRVDILWMSNFVQIKTIQPHTHTLTQTSTQFQITHAAIQISIEFRNNCVIRGRLRSPNKPVL